MSSWIRFSRLTKKIKIKCDYFMKILFFFFFETIKLKMMISVLETVRSSVSVSMTKNPNRFLNIYLYFGGGLLVGWLFWV